MTSATDPTHTAGAQLIFDAGSAGRARQLTVVECRPGHSSSRSGDVAIMPEGPSFASSVKS